MKYLSILLLLLMIPAQAQTHYPVPELGFSVDLPIDWLTNSRSHQYGLKMAKDEVWIRVDPYQGITRVDQIERVRSLEKMLGSEFKEEWDITVHQMPAHYMNFYQDGKYRIYYVFDGYLWRINSRSTDSPAFLQAQEILMSFEVDAPPRGGDQPHRRPLTGAGEVEE